MAKSTYEFYLELRDSNPKIWRIIQVNSNITVADFIYIVLPLFEMEAAHLFKVTVPVGLMQVENLKHYWVMNLMKKHF